MSDQQTGEKEEKEGQRREKEEKERGEKWRRDPLSAIVWAAVLIWAGIVFLADNLGLFALPEKLQSWGIVFIGAGLIVLLEALVRVLMPEYRRPVLGTIIFGVVLIGVGLGDLVSWVLIGPLALIAVGVAILLRGFLGRRE